MKIAVLGAGAGGTAVAFDWAAHGHEVRLFDFERFPDNIRHVATSGRIEAEGGLEGAAPIAYSGHEIETAMRGADIVFVVGPAFATRPFAAACAPFLEAGQEVVVCPGSTGGASSGSSRNGDSASSLAWPPGPWPQSWPIAIASTSGTFRLSAVAIERATWATSSAWVIRFR